MVIDEVCQAARPVRKVRSRLVYTVVVVVVALLRSIRRSLLGPGLWGVSGILLSSSVASRDRLGLSS